MQKIILFIFCLNCWFNRAYINGFAAELNKTIMSTIAITNGLMLRDGKFLNTYSTDSAPQQIPNMALTTIAIKVARFRTLMTPCV